MRAYRGPHGPCKLKTYTGQIGIRRIDRLRSINSAPDPHVIYCAGSSFSSRHPVDVLVIKLRDRSIVGREVLIDTCYGLFVLFVALRYDDNEPLLKVNFKIII